MNSILIGCFELSTLYYIKSTLRKSVAICPSLVSKKLMKSPFSASMAPTSLSQRKKAFPNKLAAERDIERPSWSHYLSVPLLKESQRRTEEILQAPGVKTPIKNTGGRLNVWDMISAARESFPGLRMVHVVPLKLNKISKNCSGLCPVLLHPSLYV